MAVAKTSAVLLAVAASMMAAPVQAQDFPARAIGDRFEIRTTTGWQPFYIKGVNIGAAMPGKYASEFPDSATYVQWLDQIGRMGANTIRIYTVHPPHFYQALRVYNQAHSQPLWLVHGVWAELPPNDVRYDDAEWEGAFFKDIRDVVDILHGRAMLPVRAGYANGNYTADVSAWTLGFILGREWESHSVAGWNQLRPQLTSYRGKYLSMPRGTPMDAWMVKASEEAVRYEMEKYNAQRPVAYTNWPTTDPLAHPSESSVMVEASIRRVLGEKSGVHTVLEGEDVVTLDPSLVKATSAFPAGWFASYHVYPYFPDFMVMSREFNQATSPFGASNYWGYITALKRHHKNIPLLISEYGVPSSIGIAHFHPQGWHHGGNTEAFMAEVNARMTKEIAAAGAAGGIIFEWIDEWFKKTWNTARFEVPLDRNRLWHNRMDAEEHYGLIAMEPGEIRPLEEGRALHADANVRVFAKHDEAYLRLRIEPVSGARDEVLIGLDVIDAAAGGFAWPDRVSGPLTTGIEFSLRISADEARLFAHPSALPLRIVGAHQELKGKALADLPPVGMKPFGFFRGRYGTVLNLPLTSRRTQDGEYEPLRVLTSRSRWMRDSTEVDAMGYEWGYLPPGPLPDGLWQRDERTGVIEVRIPWQLINVSDPSSRRVLHEPAERLVEGNEIGTKVVEDIGVVVALRKGATWTQTPTVRFTWPTWEQPRWRARLKPSYGALRDAWRELEPPVLKSGVSR